MTQAPLADGTVRLGDLATGLSPLDAQVPVAELESWLGTGPDAAAVAFRHRGKLRLIDRMDLDQQLRGRLGFGAALLRRRTLGDLVSLPALTLPASAAADDAARLALARPAHQRFSPVVVESADGRLGLVSMGVLLEHLAERYAGLAFTDALTGLGNRLALNAAADAELDGSGPVALFLFDLDRFQEVNDAMGHRAGDQLLQRVGGALERASAGTAPVFRIGGDEFAVLLSDFQRPFPEHVAGLGLEQRVAWIGRQILREVRGPYDIGGVPITVEASIGAAHSPVHGADIATLFSRADAAMHAAKRDRLGVQVWQPQLTMADRSDLRLLAELRDGISAGQLRLHYQPLVDATDGAIRGVEALVRWQHPVRGLLAPGTFITQAERADVILELTDWVLTEAITQAARWHDGGNPLPVSVNLAAPALGQDHIVDTITGLLRAHALPPELLVVEVTESAVMARPDEVVARLRALSMTGVRVAMDDFGTGNTSLALLTRLPLHELKLDRSLIIAMSDDRGYAIVAAVAQLSRSLGLVLVGEGIEDAATATTLAGLGFDLLQGYHFGRPVPAGQIDTGPHRAPARLADARS